MFPDCQSTESMNANADFFVSVAVQSKLSVILSTPMCSNVMISSLYRNTRCKDFRSSNAVIIINSNNKLQCDLIQPDNLWMMMTFTLAILCLSSKKWEIWCNRFQHTCSAAEPLSSRSKQLHDQRQGEQSMSKVIGLSCLATLLENYYS